MQQVIVSILVSVILVALLAWWAVPVAALVGLTLGYYQALSLVGFIYVLGAFIRGGK